MILTSTATFAPGSSPPGEGPSHSPSVYDHLPTPWGTIGNLETDALRRFFHKLGIPQSHFAGRNVLCEKYREILAKIGGEASDRAVKDFLSRFKD